MTRPVSLSIQLAAVAVVLLPAAATQAQDAAASPTVGWDATYSASLTPVRADDLQPEQLQVRFFLLDRSPIGQLTVGYLVEEEDSTQWLWPERFGTMRLTDAFARIDAKLGAALLYDLKGEPIAVQLPLPLFGYSDRLKQAAKFTVGNQRYEVIAARRMRDRDCWQVEVTGDAGWQRVLWVQHESPLLVGVDQRVFLTGGQEFRLSLRLEQVAQLSDDELQKRRAALDALLALKAQLDRPDAETADTLTTEQLDLASEALPQLKEQSQETLFADFVTAIDRDLTRQLQREGDLESLVKNRVGKPAPAFELATLGRKTISDEGLKDKITVLHFWDYRGEPFVEPYGQVGYLDFLLAKRRKEGVQVYGIAVSPELGQAGQRREALRKIRKLRQFMNLSYPIGLDSGTVLRSFGDPRQVGAKLPLYVVVGPDGNVAHYHAGFYEIKADEGLRALDAVINEVKAPKPDPSREAGGPDDG